MLHTFLTDQWGLRYPIIGAPMAGAGYGGLARAISRAGGLGMIGVGSTAHAAAIAREADIAGDEGGRYGLALMIWALEERPELLDAAIAAKPFLLSLSFGSPAPYMDRVHAAGIKVVTQVNSVAAAIEAERAGVDLIVAQGTEAGGHTGRVATLPLLQGILDAVGVPVVAAGGIATARGLAAVLAAGAQGAWLGTVFLASPENGHTDDARRRVVEASEADTVLTYAFDRVQGFAWPAAYPGRALRNRFTDEWHERSDEAVGDAAARQQYEAAAKARDHDVAVIYAGQAVGLVQGVRSAGEIVQELGEGAEALLHRQSASLLGT